MRIEHLGGAEGLHPGERLYRRSVGRPTEPRQEALGFDEAERYITAALQMFDQQGYKMALATVIELLVGCRAGPAQICPGQRLTCMRPRSPGQCAGRAADYRSLHRRSNSVTADFLKSTISQGTIARISRRGRAHYH